MEIDLQANLLKFLLILFRCSTFFILTPVFGRRELPAIGKIGLAALVSILLYPIVTDVVYYDNVFYILLMVIKEITIGIAMGYITVLMFSCLYTAGELIDLEMGFGIVNVIDPQSNAQVPLMGNFYYILMLLIFLTVDGHHVLLSALVRSYEIVPLGEGIFQQTFFDGIVMSFRDMFFIGVKVSLPIVSIIFITDLALGIIARTVPQMNVFIVGLPLKISVGIIAMILALPMYLIALDVIFSRTYENIYVILKGMR